MSLIALCILLLASGAALAQQPQQGDPALNACQQLLTGANNNLIQIAAQATIISRQLDAAQAELTKLKQPSPDAGKPKD